jgi:hypothetical protein
MTAVATATVHIIKASNCKGLWLDTICSEIHLRDKFYQAILLGPVLSFVYTVRLRTSGRHE